MKKRSTSALTVLLFAALLVISYLTYKTYFQNSSFEATPTLNYRQYQSKSMGFTIDVPPDLVIEEQVNSISIENEKGTIWITQSGTNFGTFEEFWQDYKKGNAISEEKRFDNDGWIIISYGVDERKGYLIFKEGKYYTLSTEEDALFDVLDQIT